MTETEIKEVVRRLLTVDWQHFGNHTEIECRVREHVLIAEAVHEVLSERSSLTGPAVLAYQRAQLDAQG